jgi:hypothetical protein
MSLVVFFAKLAVRVPICEALGARIRLIAQDVVVFLLHDGRFLGVLPFSNNVTSASMALESNGKSQRSAVGMKFVNLRA